MLSYGEGTGEMRKQMRRHNSNKIIIKKNSTKVSVNILAVVEWRAYPTEKPEF